MKSRKNAKIIPFPKQRSHKYPNAAERSYYLHELTDYLLCTVTGFGLGAVLIFIFFIL